MKSISGFTFIHNAIVGGYPIVEAIRAVRPYVDEIVAVDMQSTDSTRQVLEKLPVKIIDGQWGNQAGETLRQAHSQYRQCSGDIIIHFEGDEVYEPGLMDDIIHLIGRGVQDIAVHRLQLEQNFQRCRWYPEPVHRVFPQIPGIYKEGHTTSRHGQAETLGPESGYLWDITNCFRDNWFRRVEQQAELRGAEPQYIMAPLHILHEAELSEIEVQHQVYCAKHWEWKSTPFAIPEILKPLVGMVRYEQRI